MKTDNKRRLSDQFIKFSIGAKLVIIITILVLFSLGTITFLVSYMVKQDLEIFSEENNFEVNRRAAAQTDYTLSTVYSISGTLIQFMNVSGANSDLAKQAARIFFEQNVQIAALVFPLPSQDAQYLVNDKYLYSHNIDTLRVRGYFEMNPDAYRRAARGESVFLNATGFFNTHLLALFFPIFDNSAVMILFSPDNLSDIYSSTLNETYLINSEGDILIYHDYDMIRVTANIANRKYVRNIRLSPISNKQELIEDEGKKYFAAYTKLNTGATIVITMIEYDAVFEGINATTRRNIFLSFAVLCASIMFIWFFAKTISVALKILANAARKIEGGIFDIDLVPKSRDEIGFLTTSFQRMSKALSVFGRFVNREIALKAMRGEIKPGGLPKHATIFFSDIRGFTEKSEIFTKEFGKRASDMIVFWLNNYFTQMVDCVEKTNGVVDKFIGDAVMAHWGTAYTAGSPAKDAFNCVKAALLMRKALIELNSARKEDDPSDPPICIGCGINTGIVTAGQLGSDKRMEYTVIGDPVNLASRIEALNKPLGTDILISEDTWKLVNYFFITEEMPAVTVKGKEKPVRIFAVINHVSVTSGPKTLAEVRELLGITPPDITKVDLNAEEKKYKISSGQ